MSTEIETIFSVSDLSRFHYLEFGAGHFRPSVPRCAWELVYVDKGRILATLDGQERMVERGNAYILKPGDENALQVDDKAAANLYCIVFGLSTGDLTAFTGKILPIPPELRTYIKIILKEAKFAYRNDLRNPDYTALERNEDRPLGTEQMMKTLLEQLLIGFARQAMAKPSKGYAELARENLIMLNMDVNPYFSNLIHYLEQNINEQLTIEQICKDNFTNRSKVQKVFKECTTEGVISFHQKLKIEYAKIMIRETHMNFTQISEELGFSSVHHFSKKFKQLVKMSPSDYARFAK